MKSKTLLIISALVFIGLNAYSQISNFPKIMYVNASAGLRLRAEPSSKGNVRGTVAHGERIVVYERTSKPDTINGITDYWYKLSYDGWVFGAYISDTLPSDLPAFLGLWENTDNSRHIYHFNSKNEYKEGEKYSEWFSIGKWEYRGTTLTLITERGAYEKLAKPKIDAVQISIINRNTIVLKYQDGKQVRLVRSKDLDITY